MNQKILKIKEHFVEHKKLYFACGVTAIVTGVAVLSLQRKQPTEEGFQKVTQIGFRNQANPLVINLIEHSTPSKPVHLVGTNLYFSSLHEASRKTGHSLTKLSRHINGHVPDLNGDVFELLQPVV